MEPQVNKRRLKQPVEMGGKGLFLGKPCTVALHPAAEGEGVRIETPAGVLRVSPDAVAETANFTYLKKDGVQVYMVEHLLAALYASRIGNVRVQISSEELPILDGSALPWVNAIRKAGVVDQAEPWPVVEVGDPLAEYDGDRFLGVFPASRLRLGFYFAHPHPRLERTYFEWTYEEGEFGKEIAPARTFTTESDWEALKVRGLARFVSDDEGLLFTAAGPHVPLRFPNEPVRHKVLDLLGDFSISGVWVKGFVMGFRSGHLMNHRLARQLAAGNSSRAAP